MWFYVSGVLMAFMEPDDPRMERIRASVLERAAAIEAEARQQERERIQRLAATWLTHHPGAATLPAYIVSDWLASDD
jgi:hypothetical protein